MVNQFWSLNTFAEFEILKKKANEWICQLVVVSNGDELQTSHACHKETFFHRLWNLILKTEFHLIFSFLFLYWKVLWIFAIIKPDFRSFSNFIDFFSRCTLHRRQVWGLVEEYHIKLSIWVPIFPFSFSFPENKNLCSVTAWALIEATLKLNWNQFDKVELTFFEHQKKKWFITESFIHSTALHTMWQTCQSKELQIQCFFFR